RNPVIPAGGQPQGAVPPRPPMPPRARRRGRQLGRPQIGGAPSVAMTAVFQKSEPALASQEPAQVFKFEREDWALFRTVEGLQQKAGVAKGERRRLILKELADNGLDTGTAVRVGKTGEGYFVEDDGGGIDPDDVARLFSISRPMMSTKLW